VFSPKELSKKSNIVISRIPSAEHFRNRPRYFSNKEFKESDADSLKFAGKLAPLEESPVPMDFGKTSNFGGIENPQPAEVLKHVNLSPNEFEFTHNFSFRPGFKKND
jgi:hypothetical protein